MATVRAQADGLDRGRWRELAETGVFALRLPEADGGVGLGMTEAVLVFEELGRSLVPGPLLATHLAAGLVDGAARRQRGRRPGRAPRQRRCSSSTSTPSTSCSPSTTTASGPVDPAASPPSRSPGPSTR